MQSSMGTSLKNIHPTGNPSQLHKILCIVISISCATLRKNSGLHAARSEQNPVESSRAANILTLFDTLLLVDCFGFRGKLFFLEHKP